MFLSICATGYTHCSAMSTIVIEQEFELWLTHLKECLSAIWNILDAEIFDADCLADKFKHMGTNTAKLGSFCPKSFNAKTPY